MAELFLARDPTRDELIVIKRILPYLSTEPEFVQMFLDEARIAAQLNHSNVVQVYELGKLDQSIFLSMEFVDGVDLRKILQEEMKAGMAVPHAVAAWITARVCDGLFYAHNGVGIDGRPLELIHRDISPQNVMVGYDGRIKIVDFGIAKANAFMERSKPGVIKGKFLYLSPEQLSQDRVDHRADLFAVGTMLYEVTTGKSPFFKPTTEAVILAIRSENPPPPHLIIPDYPAELSRIIMKCLTKDRSRRYQQASEIASDLDAFAQAHARADQGFLSRYVGMLFGDEGDRTVLHIPSGPDPLIEEVRAAFSRPPESAPPPARTRPSGQQVSAGRRITSEQPVITATPSYSAEPPTRGARPSTLSAPAASDHREEEGSGATVTTTGHDDPRAGRQVRAASGEVSSAAPFVDDGPVFDTLTPMVPPRPSEGPEPTTRPESPRASRLAARGRPSTAEAIPPDERTDEFLGDADDDASTSTFAALAARSRAQALRRLTGSRNIILASIAAAVLIIIVAGVIRALRSRADEATPSPADASAVQTRQDAPLPSPSPESSDKPAEAKAPAAPAVAAREPDGQAGDAAPDSERVPLIVRAPTGTRLTVGSIRLAPEKTYRFEPGMLRVAYRCPGRRGPAGTRQISLQGGTREPRILSISCRRK